ncbi:L-cysteate sulfo-lyase [Constrictibacter sp. MBR-5]|jgi:L-cysteate sulfo-lyase|uniref:D-cysteine desulfhydrase n=1 Tax=Constrictibacter sp. MBR-5 TaxID=3156467 RepID=UPI0033995D4E
MDLARFPRFRLCHAPTPLEPMDRLSALLGGPRLWVKRDDCTGLATGGNKTRKLEFLIGAALAEGADTVLTVGATQSNHVRQTAAAAAKAGLACEVLLERRITDAGVEYDRSGNVLLDGLLGARIHYVPKGTDMDAALETLAEEIRIRSGRPYAFPAGGSNPVGALGYAWVAGEIEAQANDRDLRFAALVHATGSAGTQAGLVAGFAANSNATPVLGISVGKPRETLEQTVRDLAAETAELLGITSGVEAGATAVDDGYFGTAYGVPTPGMIEAVELTARHEGLLLDPVYSGKAMAGLIDHVRNGTWQAGEDVLFLHTGGIAGLFGYRSTFDRDNGADSADDTD